MKNQLPPLLALLLILARKELGVKETPPGSNRGPRVEEYLHSVHLGPGYAWCAAICLLALRTGLSEPESRQSAPQDRLLSRPLEQNPWRENHRAASPCRSHTHPTRRHLHHPQNRHQRPHRNRYRHLRRLYPHHRRQHQLFSRCRG